MTRKEKATSLDSVDRPLRTTIFLTEVLDHNLDLLTLETGRPKGELIREGISMLLEQHGYPADKKAAFTIKKGGDK